jgi:sugar phosphate isomerase/epimerase
MGPMRPCLNRATLGAGSFTDFLDAAAAAGFPMVEAGIEPLVEVAAKDGPKAAADVLARRKLKLAAFFASPQWRTTDEEFERTFQAFPRQVEVAARLGVVRCLTWVPPSTDTPADEYRKAVVPRLKRIHEALRAAGCSFALEWVGPKTSRRAKHEFVWNIPQALSLADEVGGDVGLLVDSYHWYTSGATVADLAALPLEQIHHVHINDAPDKPRDEQLDMERLLPGDGIIDLAGFLGALERVGYAGPVSIETFNADVRALPLPDAAKLAKSKLDRVLAAA